MASNAKEYAESVGKGFWEAYNAGHVFGLQPCEECTADTDDPCDCEVEREPVSAYDWLSDVLDMNYVIDSQGDYKGAEIFITIGGPGAWVDTRDYNLQVSWGGDRAQWSLPSEMIDALDEACEEMWGMR